MNEPIWVEVKTAINIHDGQVALFGGSSGIRDIGLLESALDRPKNRFFYEPCTLLELAAAYAFAISGNHPFIDGNKRTAFVVMATFLVRNGLRMTAGEIQAVLCFQALAAGELSETELADWLKSNTAPRNPSTS
ncbi:MAG: type II toxin-antitoxin system death-on-curing family toxin [Fimbriimonadaceae bacterium]